MRIGNRSGQRVKAPRYLRVGHEVGDIRGDGAVERYRGILHDAYVEAVLLEDLEDALPTRAADELAVYQNNVVDFSAIRALY